MFWPRFCNGFLTGKIGVVARGPRNGEQKPGLISTGPSGDSHMRQGELQKHQRIEELRSRKNHCSSGLDRSKKWRSCWPRVPPRSDGLHRFERPTIGSPFTIGGCAGGATSGPCASFSIRWEVGRSQKTPVIAVLGSVRKAAKGDYLRDQPQCVESVAKD